MAINTHQADHVEYIQDSDGIKHYLNAEYLDGHSYGDIKSSVANHYTPAADSSAQLSVDASSTTAATWNSTSLVTGVNLQRDAKGHVTGVTVDSIKMPANPNTDTHYTNYLQIKGNGIEAVKFTQNADKSLNLKPGNNVSISAASGEITISATDTNTHNSHAIISGTKSNGSTQIKGSASSGDITLGDSGVTAGAYGDTTAQTPGYNATFKVPSISVNAKGIVTAIGEHTVKIPASDNTDTKNTAGSTNDSSTLYLIGARTQVANSQTYSNSNVYMSNGTLTASRMSANTLNVSGTDATVSGHLAIYGDNDDDNPKKPTDRTGISNSGGDVDAYYFNTGITLYDSVSENAYKLSFPGKTGTIALTSDLPTKVSELTNDSGYVKGTDLKKINNNSLIGSGNINIPTMSHRHDHKGPYSADNKNDHTVYSESSTAYGNGNGCLIMVHGHIIYQSGYINITDTSTFYTDQDSYAIQAGQEGYWGKSWVTATAFFEPGRKMYVHAKGVESIYVVCVYF